MAITQNKNLFDRLRRLIISQYQESNILELAENVINQMQELENDVFFLLDAMDLSKANGIWLDNIGSILSTKRLSNEADVDYRQRLQEAAQCNTAGTPNNVIDNSSKITKSPNPQYIEEGNATFLVYTPNGSQIKRAQIKRLAPAGVLGLPAVAFQLADGSILATESSYDFELDQFKPINERTLCVCVGQDVEL